MAKPIRHIDADIGLRLHIARYHLSTGDIDQAEAAVRALLAVSSGIGEHGESLGTLLSDLIQTCVARRDILRASALVDEVQRAEQLWEVIPLVRAVARVDTARGDYSAAARHMQRVVTSAHHTSKDWLDLARVYEAAGDTTAATEAYLCAAREDSSHATVLRIATRLAALASSMPTVPESSCIRIAIVGSSTLHDIQSYLEVSCRLAGLVPQFYLGPYGQYAQDILDPGSQLYAFQPDIVITAIHGTALFPELYNDPFALDVTARREAVREAVERTVAFLAPLTRYSQALVLLHTFATPQHSPLGIFDLRAEYGQSLIFHTINDMLADRVRREFPAVHLVDEERVYGRIGKRNVTDPRLWFLARIGIGEGALGALTDEYMRYIKAVKGRTRKCLVLDLDNTLWGGVVGEDGIAGIALGEEAPGNAFVAFQRAILTLYQRGIILAINSKNNETDALEVLERHPDMVLRPQHFAAMRINWLDKASNLHSIADELNIGLDSLVFIDDNPAERALVRTQLPQVLTVELPNDPALYRASLLKLTDFDSLALTDEDRQRGQMYAQRRERRQWEATHGTDLGSYLDELQMVVEIGHADEFALPRIAQLISKTNQFNLTTRRHSDAVIREFWHSDTRAVFAVRVRDRFGDHGLVGAMITVRSGDTVEIDSLLLSCRVLGRGVETAMLSALVTDARQHGASVLRGIFVPTAKNAPAREVYAQHGFTCVAEDAGTHAQTWELNVMKQSVEPPAWLTLRGLVPAAPAAR